jgi:tetratricopeptide (TPR) repeat protein
MPRLVHFSLAILMLALVAVRAPAQNVAPDDPPKLLAPRQPASKAERDRRESLYRFVYGRMCEREDRWLEAQKAYAEAAELDPQSAAVHRAQLPLLIALERPNDALAAANKVLDRDQDDYEVWTILSRLHKAMGHPRQAREALERGLKATGLDERPELAQQMNYDLGTLYEAEQNFAAAADAYTRSAQLLDHPDVIAEHAGVGKDLVLQKAAETYERIGELYRKAKQYDQAIKSYAKAQERAPLRAERLHFNLAQISSEMGDDARALVHLDAYLRTQPLGVDAYEMKIKVLQRMKKDADIVPWLEQSAKRDAYNVSLQLVLARECGKARQVGRAEQIYRTVADTSPSPELYRGWLRLYVGDNSGNMAVGLKQLDQTIARAANKAQPDNVAAQQAKAIIAALREDGDLAQSLIGAAYRSATQGMPLRVETLQVLGVLSEKHRLLTEAERFYRNSLKQVSPEAEALVYSGLLRVLAKARRLEAQVEVCDGALNGNASLGLPKAQATKPVLFLTEKARALAGLHRHDEAVQAADRALVVAAEDNKLIVRLLRVRLLMMANRHDDAEKDCMALLKQYTQPAETLEVRYLLSNVYSAAKQHARAEEQLQMVLKVDPENATANNDLGYLWADLNKNLAQAEEMIRRAIENDRRQRRPSGPGEPGAPGPIVPTSATLAEDNAAYVDSLGWVLYRRGRVEEARMELERAARLPDGEDPVIWEHLGEVYHDLQMPTEARRAWEHAVKLYEQGERRVDEDRCRELREKLKAR